jgi:hypothetical protein
MIPGPQSGPWYGSVTMLIAIPATTPRLLE